MHTQTGPPSTLLVATRPPARPSSLARCAARAQTLYLGAEGTLGVITEVTVRTFPIPKVRCGAVVSFETVADAARTVVRATEANLETVLTAMRTTNAVDERGDRIVIRPTHLVVPPALIFTANKILRSVQLPGSANNDINPLQGALIPVSWRALTDSASAAAFWVIQAGRGLRVYDSGVPRLRQYPHMNGDISIIADFSFGATVTNARYHYCANKAAS